jgi:hypothetical protein
VITYLLDFVFEYIKYGHDNAPNEKDADEGSLNFYKFKNFID